MTGVPANTPDAWRRSVGRPPSIRRSVVAPDVVIERLDTAVGCVAAVSAPGGYGKTSQVASWTGDDARPVAWIRLDACDDVPGTVLRMLVEALSSVTDFDVDAIPWTATASRLYSTTVAPALAHAVGRCELPFVLVIDDFHSLTNPSAVALVVAIAENVPAGSTVVLAGRNRLGAAFARARLEPGIVDIGPAELALDREGVARVLSDIGVAEDDALIDRILRTTEGWPAGVRLAGLESADAAVAPRDQYLPATEQSVTDYVNTEWLRGLTASECDFLMRVSGMDWLSPAMCDFLLDRVDSGRLLHSFHENRLTVLPLDRHGSSFRMHRILRDVLLTKFDHVDRRQRQLTDLRASEWFEQCGDIDRAVRHAQRGGDLSRMTRLITDHAVRYQTVGRHDEVAGWIGLLPRSLVVTHTDLCVVATVSALGMGHGDEASVWNRMASAGATRDATEHPVPEASLRAAALNALIGAGSIDELMHDAVAAYDGLPPGALHATACGALGALHFALGDVDAACARLSEGAAEAAVAEARTDEAHCRAHLSIALDELGDSQACRDSALQARQVVIDHRLGDVPTLFLVSAVSALAAARDGDAPLAESEMELTYRHMAHYRSVAGLVNVQVRHVLAQTALILGDLDRATSLSCDARSFLSAWPDSVLPARRLARLERELTARRDSTAATSPLLSDAELRVLLLLPTNLRHREIAEQLYLSRNTVKTHAASIYRKLGAASRSEAVDRARGLGLLPTAAYAARP
jgi:LuxR family maltose regulon positive regulatory protein